MTLLIGNTSLIWKITMLNDKTELIKCLYVKIYYDVNTKVNIGWNIHKTKPRDILTLVDVNTIVLIRREKSKLVSELVKMKAFMIHDGVKMGKV